jgi:hypothetical protein
VIDFISKKGSSQNKMLTDQDIAETLERMGREMSGHDALNRIEACFAAQPDEWHIDLPVKHTFTPGIYAREIYMPAGVFLTTVMHMTEHPFVVSAGEVSVWTPSSGLQRIKAPFSGVTKPGTRRLLYIHEDTIWTTFHATDLTDPREIIESVAVIRPNNLLSRELEPACLRA